MKTKLSLAVALTIACLLAGCATSNNANVGPGLLRLGVSTAAGYAIMQQPEAAPGVRAGAAIVCATAHGTNVSPAQIVAAINAYGELKPEAVFILNAAIGAYSLVFNGLADTNTVVTRPYALAVCDGLNDALLLSPETAKVFGRLPPTAPIPFTQWPQVQFKK